MILDRRESHISAQFEVYCKDNKVIALSMSLHSPHLLQPLDLALVASL